MGLGAKLAMAIPAVAALWPSSALADGDDRRNRDDDGRGRGFGFNGVPFGRPFPFPGVRPFTQSSASTGAFGLGVRLRLAAVGQVNGGTGGDFAANNPGGEASRSRCLLS